MQCQGKPEKGYNFCDTCGGCGQCHGCTDDRCGGCSKRWCSGAYLGEPCDRCPEKVDKEIPKYDKGPLITIKVRCNASEGHTGIHHYDPWKAGR